MWTLSDGVRTFPQFYVFKGQHVRGDKGKVVYTALGVHVGYGGRDGALGVRQGVWNQK